MREAARIAARSEETIRRWIWSGKITARKLGNQLFVKEHDLRGLLAPRVREAAVAYKAEVPAPDDHWRTTMKTNLLYKKYGYSPAIEALREHRGQILPGAEEAWRDMEDDERFQDEMFAKYGAVDVQGIFRDLREP